MALGKIVSINHETMRSAILINDSTGCFKSLYFWRELDVIPDNLKDFAQG